MSRTAIHGIGNKTSLETRDRNTRNQSYYLPTWLYQDGNEIALSTISLPDLFDHCLLSVSAITQASCSAMLCNLIVARVLLTPLAPIFNPFNPSTFLDLKTSSIDSVHRHCEIPSTVLEDSQGRVTLHDNHLVITLALPESNLWDSQQFAPEPSSKHPG